MNFTDPQVSQLIELAIAEDIGDGDHSSLGAIVSNEKGKARLLVKDAGVLCGIHLAKHIFHRLDSTLVFEPYFSYLPIFILVYNAIIAPNVIVVKSFMEY